MGRFPFSQWKRNKGRECPVFQTIPCGRSAPYHMFDFEARGPLKLDQNLNPVDLTAVIAYAQFREIRASCCA